MALTETKSIAVSIQALLDAAIANDALMQSGIPSDPEERCRFMIKVLAGLEYISQLALMVSNSSADQTLDADQRKVIDRVYKMLGDMQSNCRLMTMKFTAAT
jgi:hypothetical protein